MNERIARLAYFVLHSDVLSKFLNGDFDKLLSVDMSSIIERFNNGDLSALNDEQIELFLGSVIEPYDVLYLIINLKDLLALRNTFAIDVLKEKDAMTFNPENVYSVTERYRRQSVTYQQVIDAIHTADKVLSNSRIYQLLNFCLKYEPLIGEIQQRKNVIASRDIPSEDKDKFLALLKNKDTNIGIVRVADSQDGISIHAGTRKDMAISDIIGKPFARDVDTPGYDYGPHGDYYMPPRKVVKTFHEDGYTALHQRMVRDEKIKRARLSLSDPNEVGYIYNGQFSIIITKGELIQAGIDPVAVGWKPMKLEVKPIKISSISKNHNMELGITERVVLKKDLLIKGRK